MQKNECYHSQFVILFHEILPEMHSVGEVQDVSENRRGGVDDLVDRGSHWDLMFELDQRLETWAVKRLPRALFSAIQIESLGSLSQELLIDDSDCRFQPLSALRLTSHRMDYLSYEGPVSERRGSVYRLLEGVYRCLGTETNFNLCQLKLEIFPTIGDNQNWLLKFNQSDPLKPTDWQLKISKTSLSTW